MKSFLIFLVFSISLFDLKSQKTASTHTAKNDPTIIDPGAVEKLPKFPGGQKAFYEFISKNLKWPKADGGETNGRVIITFTVARDGRLTEYKIIRSLGKEFDNEVLRVIKLSPRWIPGTQNAKSVRVKYTMPISFAMDE